MPTFFIAPASHATTPGHDTNGTGTTLLPWLTISKAHTSAASGDTIICKDGTHTWSSQTFTKSLTIQAENTGLAIFDGAAATISWVLVPNMVKNGLRFTNATATSSAPLFSGGADGLYLFQRCTFGNISISHAVSGEGGLIGTAFSLTGNPTYRLISCLINDITSAGQNALFGGRTFGTTNMVITWDLQNTVIYIANTGANRIQTLFFLAGNAGTNPTIAIIIKNSIISNASGLTVNYRGGSGTHNTNALSNSGFFNITTVPAGTANFTTNPLFENVAGGNFNLRPTSPAQSKGTLV